MLLEHKRDYALDMDGLVNCCSWNANVINYASGMDGLVTVCSRNTNVILLCGQGCSGSRVLLEKEGYYALICFGYGCFGYRMLSEHERSYGLGMDALVTVCSWNTNDIRLFAFGSAAASGLCCWNTSNPVSKIIRMCLGARPLTGAISKSKKRNIKDHNNRKNSSTSNKNRNNN